MFDVTGHPSSVVCSNSDVIDWRVSGLIGQLKVKVGDVGTLGGTHACQGQHLATTFQRLKNDVRIQFYIFFYIASWPGRCM